MGATTPLGRMSTLCRGLSRSSTVSNILERKRDHA